MKRFYNCNVYTYAFVIRSPFCVQRSHHLVMEEFQFELYDLNFQVHIFSKYEEGDQTSLHSFPSNLYKQIWEDGWTLTIRIIPYPVLWDVAILYFTWQVTLTNSHYGYSVFVVTLSIHGQLFFSNKKCRKSIMGSTRLEWFLLYMVIMRGYILLHRW